MRIGVPRESRAGETLVAATAKTASRLVKLGYDVVVESGAGGRRASPTRRTPTPASRVGSAEDVWASDIVVKVNAPTDDEVGAAAPRRHGGLADGAGTLARSWSSGSRPRA